MSDDNSAHNTNKRKEAIGMTKASKETRRRRVTSMSGEDAIQALIPVYLTQFVYAYHGDFCYTPCFAPALISQVMAEGFLPIASEGTLLPKLHRQRCVISLPNELHVSKSVRKKSKRFEVSISESFEEVIKCCHEQHGSHCWLVPPLVQAFREMFNKTKRDGGINVPAMDTYGTGKPKGNNQTWTVRLYTMEVWNVETGELAGGELGYSVGSIYTSLTGFSKEDSAGSVQLAALGRLLISLGFTIWDLGMDMEYKRSLGSKLMPRKEFLQHVHRVRDTHPHLRLHLSSHAETKTPTEKQEQTKEGRDASPEPKPPNATTPTGASEGKTKASKAEANPQEIKSINTRKNAKIIIDAPPPCATTPPSESGAPDPSVLKKGTSSPDAMAPKQTNKNKNISKIASHDGSSSQKACKSSTKKIDSKPNFSEKQPKKKLTYLGKKVGPN